MNNPNGGTSGSWTFVAMRYHSLILNRTYKVFVTDQFICGARVHGVIGSPLVEEPRQENPASYIHARLAARYEKLELASDAFLRADRANFRIQRSEVERIDYAPTKWGMARVPYSGRLILRTAKGRRYELIILGWQDAQGIRARLLSQARQEE